jgi:hypothetical protein
MIERGSARERDVVIAFLQAEISSSRYSEYIMGNLRHKNLSRDLIDHPNLENEIDNNIRRALLQAYRGFGANTYLFYAFPADVVWRFVEIEPKDHHLLLFAKEENWMKIAEGTRSVSRAAGRIDRFELADTAERVRSIQQDLTSGKSMAPLILVEGENGRLILVEGHSRATAYVGLNWPLIPALLGYSAGMRNWHYY